MSNRFWLAFAGFLFLVGIGGIWLFINVIKRKRMVKNLLSLPKERRFFWFKLRNAGYQVINYSIPADFSILKDEDTLGYTLKLDFLVKKHNKKYGCLFSSTDDDKELLKLFFTYMAVYKLDGVIFYFEEFRGFSVWSW